MNIIKVRLKEYKYIHWVIVISDQWLLWLPPPGFTVCVTFTNSTRTSFYAYTRMLARAHTPPPRLQEDETCKNRNVFYVGFLRSPARKITSFNGYTPSLVLPPCAFHHFCLIGFTTTKPSSFLLTYAIIPSRIYFFICPCKKER